MQNSREKKLNDFEANTMNLFLSTYFVYPRQLFYAIRSFADVPAQHISYDIQSEREKNGFRKGIHRVTFHLTDGYISFQLSKSQFANSEFIQANSCLFSL